MFTTRYGLKLYIIRVIIKLGHVMAQAVRCQPLTTEAAYDICRARSGSGKDSSECSFLPPMVHAHRLQVALTKDKRTNTGAVSKNNARSEIGERCLENACFHRFFRQVTEHQTTFPFTFKWPSVSVITTWPVFLGPVKSYSFLGVAAKQAQPVVNSAVDKPQRLSGTVCALNSQTRDLSTSVLLI